MNHRSSLALAAALVAALSACKKAADEPKAAGEPAAAPVKAGPTAAALQPVKEVEPNDEQRRAQPIPARAVVSGEFAPKKGKIDDDWFQVSPGAGQKLALDVDLSAGESLEALDRDRNRLVRLRGAAGEPLALRRLACVETCFLHTAGSSGAYTLTVRGEPADASWELEPNDRAVDATPLAPGASIQGYYGSPGDQDFYRVALEAPRPGQFLRIELSAVIGVRPELEVRALDGVLLTTLRGAAEGQPLYVRNLSMESTVDSPQSTASADAGTEADAGLPADSGGTTVDAGPPAPRQLGYLLVVKPGAFAVDGKYRRGYSVKEPYTLTTAIENGPPDLEIEPNDDPQHATDLGPSLSRSGYLAPAGDVDWYRLHADKPSLLHVELSPLERADTELSVYAPPAKPGDKPQLLARANEGGVREGETLPAVGIAAGDTLIKVESAARNLDGKLTRDGEDRTTLYKLTAQILPDDGTTEKEPNDAAHPQIIALPATIKGWIWPRKDVDVFQFHVGEGRAPVSIKVSAVRGVDLMIVLRQGSETIGTADAVKGDGEEQILSVPLKAGDYQVEVSSPRHKDASATNAYTLTVQ